MHIYMGNKSYNKIFSILQYSSKFLETVKIVKSKVLGLASGIQMKINWNEVWNIRGSTQITIIDKIEKSNIQGTGGRLLRILS